jgi:hypothetical protein
MTTLTMITDEQILNFLIVLEALKKAYESGNGSWEGYDFNIEHKDDCIKVETGWSSPEEGGIYNFTVYLEDPIRVEVADQASTVFGDCDETYTETYVSLEQYAKRLEQYFNLSAYES